MMPYVDGLPATLPATALPATALPATTLPAIGEPAIGLLAIALADKYQDELSVESRIMRTAARTLADADRTVVRGETIDKIERELRRFVDSGGDTSIITKFLTGLVRMSREPESATVVTMLQNMYLDGGASGG